MAAMIEIANIVLFHRKEAGLSRKELADLADVGKTAIYDLEKGKLTQKLHTISKILMALNIELKLESPIMKEYEKSKSLHP